MFVAIVFGFALFFFFLMCFTISNFKKKNIYDIFLVDNYVLMTVPVRFTLVKILICIRVVMADVLHVSCQLYSP